MLSKLLQGRYQIVQVLSAGGFCQTYIAQDTRLGLTCVVKHLKPPSNHPQAVATLRRLFTREAEALKKLNNYNLVPQLLGHFEDHLEFYLVQEFIEGHPLSAELLPGQRWSESQVFQLLQEVLGILEFVHSHGLIHRDLKPSNLIRRQQDNRLVLVDFGAVKQTWTQVVKAQGNTSTTIAVDQYATIAIGTPGYMPNEQGRGRPRPNSDIYALGMIGIQALTGLHPTQLPEDGDTGELLWQHQAQVSTILARVLTKMVRYHFKDRYESVEEVLQALQPLATLYPLIEKSEPKSSVDAGLKPTFTSVRQRMALEANTNPIFGGNPSPVLIGLAIGIVSILALIVASYYSLLVPAPTPKVQQHQSSIPSQNTALAKTLTGHTNMIWSVAISPDGKTLVSSSGDKTIKIWNLQTGELKTTLTGHTSMVLSVAISPDGHTLASSSWDKTIKIWNLQTGELKTTLTGHTKELWSVAISPNGHTLASGSGNLNNIWNLGTGQLLRTLAGHSDTIWAVAISPDGQTLASGSKDKTIKLWNLHTGELRSTLIGHSDRVRAVAISPDGQTLASGSWDKTIKLWNLQTGELLNTLVGHSGYVNSVAISPNGQLVASGSDDHTIKLWNLHTGELLSTLTGHLSNINCVTFNPDGKMLVSGSGDNTLKIWRL